LELIREAEPRERILNEFQQRGSVRNAEIATYTKAGVQCDLLVNLDWVDIGGRGFILSTMQDITKRKKAESDIVQLSEDMAARNLELEDVNKELEAFTYSVSHDLSAPIRHLSGFAKILAENYADKLDDVGNNYLGRIQTGSEKATRLIDDLLRLSRISRQDMKRVEMDLSGKALEVIADLREASPGRNVQVSIAPGLKTAADPRLVEVVLSNLLGNAWKFTSKTGSAYIEFGAFECGMRNAEFGMNAQEQCEKGETVYFVKDNGAGFDPAYADKMFWPFQRLHSENEFEGTGIGLAVVERVIRRHSGRVWAKGEVGKGAAVFFTLGGQKENRGMS
jgi:light-regulated signal transduction histidine kinase (bacteriophytochrome)